MGFDPRYLSKLEATGAACRGVNANAFGTAPEVSPDLALILAAVEQAGYGRATLEHRFHPQRKWSIDAAWPAALVGFEREGGKFVWVACRCGVKQKRFVSRHHDRDGMEADAEKYNAAAAMGWSIIRATPGMLKDGRALAALLATLERKSNHSTIGGRTA